MPTVINVFPPRTVRPSAAPQPSVLKRRRRKTGPLSEETKRKISLAKMGNKCSVGHRMNPKSLANLEVKRGNRRINPRSLANLAQFNPKAKSAVATKTPTVKPSVSPRISGGYTGKVVPRAWLP